MLAKFMPGTNAVFIYSKTCALSSVYCSFANSTISNYLQVKWRILNVILNGVNYDLSE